MRIRSLLPVIALLAAACTDRRDMTVPAGTSASRNVVTPGGTLDQEIGTLIALFPKGHSSAASARWSSVKRKYQAGLTDPSQMQVAKDQLFELSAWVQKKASDMNTPPNSESKANAAARLILYMSLYVYGGPNTPPPPFSPGADDVVGLVTPSAAATVVTPTTHAGVALEAGSVGENTIVVITENPAFYAPCRGPLSTTGRVCQYPLFYTFNEFPHDRLLKAGRFAVCHVKVGSPRGPGNDFVHARLRLAHNLPADPANYTPGALRGEQYGSIEILPVTTQTFSFCDGSAYGSPPSSFGMSGALGWLARAVAMAVTPKSAYAIDQGGGGLSLSFSDFNDVDPGFSDAAPFSGAASVDTHHSAPDPMKKTGKH